MSETQTSETARTEQHAKLKAAIFDLGRERESLEKQQAEFAAAKAEFDKKTADLQANIKAHGESCDAATKQIRESALALGKDELTRAESKAVTITAKNVFWITEVGLLEWANESMPAIVSQVVDTKALEAIVRHTDIVPERIARFYESQQAKIKTDLTGAIIAFDDDIPF